MLRKDTFNLTEYSKYEQTNQLQEVKLGYNFTIQH